MGAPARLRQAVGSSTASPPSPLPASNQISAGTRRLDRHPRRPGFPLRPLARGHQIFNIRTTLQQGRQERFKISTAKDCPFGCLEDMAKDFPFGSLYRRSSCLRECYCRFRTHRYKRLESMKALIDTNYYTALMRGDGVVAKPESLQWVWKPLNFLPWSRIPPSEKAIP